MLRSFRREPFKSRIRLLERLLFRFNFTKMCRQEEKAEQMKSEMVSLFSKPKSPDAAPSPIVPTTTIPTESYMSAFVDRVPAASLVDVFSTVTTACDDGVEVEDKPGGTAGDVFIRAVFPATTTDSGVVDKDGKEEVSIESGRQINHGNKAAVAAAAVAAPVVIKPVPFRPSPTKMQKLLDQHVKKSATEEPVAVANESNDDGSGHCSGDDADSGDRDGNYSSAVAAPLGGDVIDAAGFSGAGRSYDLEGARKKLEARRNLIGSFTLSVDALNSAGTSKHSVAFQDCPDTPRGTRF